MQTFDQMIDEAQNEDVSSLKAGDTCDEDGCEKEVFELIHERNSQFDTEPHPEAPEVEVVCIHHGIVATR